MAAKELKMLINGELVSGASSFDVINPSTAKGDHATAPLHTRTSSDTMSVCGGGVCGMAK
jgi:hypothetical protein